MNLRCWFSLLVFVLSFGMTGAAVAATAPLRVMTFNVRVPVDTGANAWANRRELMVQVIKAEHPDVLGTQELTEEQGEHLAAHLPGYAWFGQGRDGGSKGEHMGVFYRTDRLEVLRKGDFWLSDTPDVPGSKTWGQPYPRMVTWAQFRRRDGGGTFDYFNTHFPYRDQDVHARMLSADELMQRIGRLPPTARVVLTGDFNTSPDRPVHAKLTRTLQDAWSRAASRSGPAYR
jgi:endonuclease/exonuclease/phosphatase family metal-dependent hydrolase